MSTGAHGTATHTANGPASGPTSGPAIALPPALRPWRDWLAMFDPEQAAAIGAMLLPLQHALGPFRAPPRIGTDEPNGIDDLRRRGPYDRLLLSEWLLADEMPDEFLRRASGGEHLFLSPRRESRKLQRRIVAVFDCGALQLGAPRLAHLALWILLARRAADAGALFEWGLLNAPAQCLAQRDEQALKALLGARHFGRASESDVRGWHAIWQDDPDAYAERWLIGAHGLDAVAHDAGFGHRAHIERDLHAHLAVSLQTPSQSRRVRVPLPGNAVAQGLLRGAFRMVEVMIPAASTNPIWDPSRALVLGPESRAVCVVSTETMAALQFRIPKHESRKPITPIRNSTWAYNTRLVYATITDKALAGVIAGRRQLISWGLPGLGCIDMNDASSPVLPDAQMGPMQCVFDRGHWGRPVLYMIDATDRLIAWEGKTSRLPITRHGQSQEPDHRLTVVADSVLCMTRCGKGRLIIARRAPSYIRLETCQLGYTRLMLGMQIPTAAQVRRALIHVEELRDGWSGAIAYTEMADTADAPASHWVLAEIDNKDRSQISRETITLPKGAIAFGVARDEMARYGITALNPQRNTVLFQTGGECRTLFASASRIQSAVAASDRDLICVLTEDGRLVVLTRMGQAPLLLPVAETRP